TCNDCYSQRHSAECRVPSGQCRVASAEWPVPSIQTLLTRHSALSTLFFLLLRSALHARLEPVEIHRLGDHSPHRLREVLFRLQPRHLLGREPDVDFLRFAYGHRSSLPGGLYATRFARYHPFPRCVFASSAFTDIS